MAATGVGPGDRDRSAARGHAVDDVGGGSLMLAFGRRPATPHECETMDLQDMRGAARDWLGRARMAFELAAPRRYVFIMSHMRSYSSLLCHILNSNPEVAGYVEMHDSYTTSFDLLKLTMRVRELTGERLRSNQYVLDKLLFNYDVSQQLLARNNIVMLFTVREPEKAIRSIVAMGLKRKRRDWKSKPDRVVDYYVRRLDQLTEIAGDSPRPTLFFEADQLIDDTPTLLDALGSFMELKAPLRSTYDTFEYTGRPKYGDPSKFITKGEIVRERTDYDQVDIPAELMDQAWTAFEHTRKVLANACDVDASRSYPDSASRPA